MHILVVNPFSSAGFLSDSFKKFSVKTTALFSYEMNELDGYVRPSPDVFDQQVFSGEKSVDLIVKSLGTRNYDFVLNGSDGSVELTDQLALRLAPSYANNPKSSNFRSNKYCLHEQLKDQGLNHIKQIIFDIEQDNILQLANLDFAYPCFIKPLSGVASYGVQKASSYAELIDYFTKLNFNEIREKLKVFANPENISKFLICEFIDGDEYIVDSYSHHGVHYISSVQKYNKKMINAYPMYRSLEVIKDDDPTWSTMVNYVKQCLTCVGLDNGFAHSEVFLGNNGPTMIEINPRISGIKGAINELARLNNFPTQPELMYNLLQNHKIKEHILPASKWVLLQLFNFSEDPLPENLSQSLKKYSVVRDVTLTKPSGYIHGHFPDALTDMVASVLCESTDEEMLQNQINQILNQDENGW